MKDQIQNVIGWLKSQPINGCITGSCLLDYFEGQDVDVFVYSEKQMSKLLYSMYYNPMFILLEETEKWKFDKFTNEEYRSKSLSNIPISIKFKYNTCIDVNVVLKKDCKNIFDVLTSFDMNIIARGIDIKTKQYLDLAGTECIATKTASYNIWNPHYSDPSLWKTTQLLRQFERCIKYHNRGYNTDPMVVTYIELIDKILNYNNIFSSISFDEKLKHIQQNFLIVKEIFEFWLKTHKITEEELLLLKEKTKIND